MKKSKIDIELINHFKGEVSISRAELLKFYKTYEPDLNNRTFGWRIWDLKKKNIIHSIKRGIYKISDQKEYNPLIDNKVHQIYEELQRAFFNNIEIVVWTTKWINDFSLHQTFRNFYLVECPSDSAESVFFKLKDLHLGNVFLKPDEDKMYQHVIDNEDSVVVKSLITKSPVRIIEKNKIPTLEKILIDLFCDNKIFYMYQGNELIHIYNKALEEYRIDFSKMITYAGRRGKAKEIKEYLSENFSFFIKDLL